jgi:predicted nucleic acid-binding protein
VTRSDGAATTSGTESAWYLDTSAAAKLVIEEEHSAALRAWVSERPDHLLASDLLRTELLRATRRLAIESNDPAVGERLVLQAQAVVDAIDLLPIPRHLFRDAGLLDPPLMRTLDALHLAVALGLGDDLDGLVTYDTRMAEAARRHAIAVISPN